jgi:TonB family protein
VSQLSQTGYGSVTREARARERRKLGPMAYVELGQDNGGILLNLGEGGFAVQSALAFQATEFAELRFQIPQVRGWQRARGRIAWMSENKTMAGIQFTELPETTRREIRKWVAGKDMGASPRDGRPAAEPRTNMSATEYRGDPKFQSPGSTEQKAPAPRSASTPGIGVVRDPAGTVPNGTQEIGARGTSREAPVHDFQFSEYSMFAAEPSPAEIWIDAGQQKRGSRRVALLSILVAVLFFVLGATVGRSTIDHWIADLETWMQGPAAPNVKPPAPVDDPSSVAVNPAETGSQVGVEANGAPSGDAHQTSNEGPGSNAGTASVAPAEAQDNDRAGGREAPKANSQAKAIAEGDEPVEGLPTKNLPSPAGTAPKQPGKSVAPRSSYATGDDEGAPMGGRSGEHSILVNAPEPGNPPFVVNLPNDAISASSTVAISARRSIQVPPRASLGGSPSERVIIGRLTSHGEPFYPMEARNRRMEGSVEVHATIGRTGHVISVRPVNGPALLASAAMTAIREWRYEPTFIDGDPVETQADITMVFRLP